MVTYRKALALLLLATTLVVGIQITAPSTEITLELDGNSVRYRVADNSYEASYDGKDFSGISIKRSSSSVSETAIEWIKVGDEWILPPGRSLFLGGQLYGAVSRVVSTIPFRQTFGDWSMDRFDGPLEQITGHSFSAPFTLTARIIGRGATDVVLEGVSSSLVATVRNGLMDNDLSLCVRDGECLYTASLQEPWTTSIKGLIKTASGETVAVEENE